jgi:hypothetical protein
MQPVFLTLLSEERCNPSEYCSLGGSNGRERLLFYLRLVVAGQAPLLEHERSPFERNLEIGQ